MRERRRQQSDTLVKALRIFASLAWLSLIVWTVILYLAAPEVSTGPTRYHNIQTRDYWLEQWAQWLPYALAFCSGFSLLALFIAPFRSRRKTDPKRIHLLVLIAIALMGFWYYWSQIITNT